jgi:exosortase
VIPPPRRLACFIVILGATLPLYAMPVVRVAMLALTQEHYSHLLIAPLITLTFFVRERHRIFARTETSPFIAVLTAALGAGLYAAGLHYRPVISENDRLAVLILSAVIIWIGAFVLCFGIGALKRGRFPAAMLLLMVPLPDAALRQLIVWLQFGTAEVTDIMFQLTGVAFMRSGLEFELPGLIIEIAEECSGIRSSVALVLTTLLAEHIFLRSAWSKLTLLGVVVPLLVVKNAVRIVTLSWLSIYVDPAFLTGQLHRNGGAVFFLAALILLGIVLVSLQRVERTYGAGLSA